MTYVRKDPFKTGKKNKRKQQEDILEIEDYCSVLLYARYVREADGDMSKLTATIVPIIRRGGLAGMPEEVCEEFDLILQKIVETVEEIDADPDFMSRLELGDVDPIGDVINAPAVTQALGNVMIRKLRVTDGLRGNQAYEEAKRLLPKVKTELTKFIGEFMFRGIFELMQEAHEKGIPLSQATKILEPKVTHIAREGIAVSTKVDFDELERIITETRDKDTSSYDPMHG
jgi:hypothetical protein